MPVLPQRLIPAHAGKTGAYEPVAKDPEAHPRSRGENSLSVTSLSSVKGSSPLTRGKQAAWASYGQPIGLIPAHAGKTDFPCGYDVVCTAHPRSRGENSTEGVSMSAVTGSSPLTRGKPHLSEVGGTFRRLIPAHAGKTLPDMRFYCADRSDLGNP